MKTRIILTSLFMLFLILLFSCENNTIKENLGDVYFVYKGSVPRWTQSGRITFVGSVSVDDYTYYCDIRTINNEGGDLNIIKTGNIMFSAINCISFSDDDKWIYFTGYEETSGNSNKSYGSIYKLSSDGNTISKIDVEGNLKGTRLSRDCQWIYYISSFNDRDEIWRVNINGSENELTGIKHGYINSIDISPDDKYLVFDCKDVNENEKIVVSSIDGKELWTLVDENDGYSVEMPCFSPDGRFVCYSKSDNGNVNNLYIVPFNGGDSIRITKNEPHNYKMPTGDFHPDWFYGNEWIVFFGKRENDNETGIYKVKVPD
ncbi:MAG: hypothetical protein ACUVWP_09450 [bacterium]